MEKLIYFLWRNPAEARDDFAKRLREEAVPDLLALELPKLQLNTVDETVRPADPMLQIHTKPRPYGVISVWVNAAQQDKGAVEEVLEKVVLRIAGYLVTESMPIVNTEQPSADGERMAGFAQVVMLGRPSRLAHEDWLDVWQGSHTQVAIDTQSTFLYVQNVVVRPVTYAAPHYDAIVEEGFPEAAMTSWEAFYDAAGDPERCQRHQGQMMASCERFIDFDKIDAFSTRRYCWG